MKIFVERSSYNAIIINGDTKLLCKFIQVCSVSFLTLINYFLSPPSLAKTKTFPPFSMSFFMSAISLGAKCSLGPPTTNKCAFLTFSKSTDSLLSPIFMLDINVLYKIPCIFLRIF